MSDATQLVAIRRVTLVLCDSCLLGRGGECHTPGCALWMNRAPDVPIGSKCEAISEPVSYE